MRDAAYLLMGCLVVPLASSTYMAFVASLASPVHRGVALAPVALVTAWGLWCIGKAEFAAINRRHARRIEEIKSRLTI